MAFPRALFFDAAGTLFTVRGSVGEHYSRIARRYGKEVLAEEIETQFCQVFPLAPPLAFPGVQDPKELKEREKAWWYELVRQVFAPFGPFPGFAAYFEELFSFFARAEAWQLYPEARGGLETL